MLKRSGARFIPLASLITLLLAVGILGAKQAGAEAMTEGERVYRDLRDLALKTSPADLKLRLDGSKVVAYGVLMETSYPMGTVTLATFISGDASLYFSNGGGIIGGVGHENVRTAAQKFLEASQKFLARMSKASQFPAPSARCTRFYVLTNQGVYAAGEFLEDDLGNKKSEFFPLFYAGQDVISALRLSQPHNR